MLLLRGKLISSAATVSGLLHAANLIHTRSDTHLQRTDVPEQWREGFRPTAPVPDDAAAGTTAFSWARRQHPDVALSLLGKLFRLRQVRLLQQGQVKRVSEKRSLEPGDVLLLPLHLPTAMPAAGPAARSSKAAHRAHASEGQRQPPPPPGSGRRQQLQQPAAAAAGRALESMVERHHHQQQQQQGSLEQPSPALLEEWQREEQLDPWAEVGQDPWAPQQQQQQQQQQQPKEQSKEQQPRALTVPQVHKWVLSSSGDIAVLCKPPGVSLCSPGPSGSSSSRLHPVLAEALRIEPPEQPRLVCGLDDDRASGAVVLSRNAPAHQWLTAWVAGEPAAVAAATAALQGEQSSSGRRGKRFVHQQRKLERLAAAAGAQAAAGGTPAVPGYSAREVAGLQQLFAAVGGLQLRRVFWAVVQGSLSVRQSGTLKNRLLHGELSLQALTRYRVLASSGGLSWLELQPLTHRTNQMRVHCAKTLGAPIVGDFKYGYRPGTAEAAAGAGPAAAEAPPAAEPWLAGRQALAAIQQQRGAVASSNSSSSSSSRGAGEEGQEGHSASSGGDVPLFLHSREVVLLRPRKPPVRVVAPVPREFRALLNNMGWQ